MSLLEKLGLKSPKNRPPPTTVSNTTQPPNDGANPIPIPQDPEKIRFGQRHGVVMKNAEELLQAQDTGKYAKAPTTVRNALATMAMGRNEIQPAIRAKDYVKANAALDKIERGLDDFTNAYDSANDGAKIAYLSAKGKAQGLIDDWDKAIATATLPDADGRYLTSAVDDYKRGRKAMDDAESQDNYLIALGGLHLVQETPRQLGDAVGLVKNAISERRVRAEKVVSGATKLGLKGVDGAGITQAGSVATTAADRIASHLDARGLAGVLDAIDAAAETCRIAAAKAFIAAGTGKPKAVRAQAIKLLKDDPEAMRAVADQPGGKALIDDMVNDLGGKAKDADSKAFVRSAITARFGTKLDDKDLTTKYLPRLYKALGKVPESHTLGNNMLKNINRERVKLLPEGDYTDGEGLINLKAPRTGLIDSLVSFGAAALPQKLTGANIVSGLGISLFDVLTLHEVGHSVDDKKQFMNGKLSNNTFGGWQQHTIDEVVSAIGAGKEFYKDFPTLPRAFLQAYLKAVLEKKTPQSESSVTGALNGAQADWKKLAKHAAVDCAEHIRLKSESSGHWEGGDSAARKHAIGSSVYQQAYGHSWVSYALSARAIKVSDYQFRGEGEWYAEAYAAYFLGKLKSSHPLHALLAADEVAGKSAQRAAR